MLRYYFGAFRTQAIVLISGLILLAIASQVFGQLLIHNEYLYKTSDCTIYLNNEIRCHDHQVQILNIENCPSLDKEQCKLANQLVSLLSATTLAPLIAKVCCIILFISMVCSAKEYNIMRGCLLFWMILYTVCCVVMSIFGFKASEIVDQQTIEANNQIREYYLLLAALHFVKLIILIVLRRCQIVHNQTESVVQQQVLESSARQRNMFTTIFTAPISKSPQHLFTMENAEPLYSRQSTHTLQQQYIEIQNPIIPWLSAELITINPHQETHRYFAK